MRPLYSTFRFELNHNADVPFVNDIGAGHRASAVVAKIEPRDRCESFILDPERRL